MTVILQDFPYFILRFALLCKFGLVTSVLFFLKNFFMVLAFVYFNVILTRWNDKKRLTEYRFNAESTRRNTNLNHQVRASLNVVQPHTHKFV